MTDERADVPADPAADPIYQRAVAAVVKYFDVLADWRRRPE